MKSTRALIAFAYVADQFAKTNDIASGLAPLFAPVISARAGSVFDPAQFAQDVKDAYDIEMHPYVAQDLAPELAKGGFLEETGFDETAQYRNVKLPLADPPVDESQLGELVDGFIAFATPRLEKVGESFSPADLREAFFDRLIQPEFLELVLRPDVPRGPNTLTLSRAQDNPAEASNTERHFDYLVARYILFLNEEGSSQFDILVAATSGALVSEVVFDLQHPLTSGKPLPGVKAAIDSPLLLDALGLGLEGAAPYAKQLIEQTESAGAKPIAFDGTVAEIRRVLGATLKAFEQRDNLYGPLGRRLRYSSTLAPYVRAIIPKIEDVLREFGVEIFRISPLDRTARQQFFSETNERELAKHLGEYRTEDALLHDARVVADVLRLRSGIQVRSIGETEIVFVTRYSRLARLSRRFLVRHSLISEDYAPPCITDRQLAGLLWISMGGGGESLSRLRLIANCSAALVPRRDIVSRMHKFFEDLHPDMVKRFEALMTNERAEHFLMDRTLADATLITRENYEEIYRDIEEVAAERVTEKKNREIADLVAKHQKEIQDITNRLKGQVLDESTRSVLLEGDLRQASEEREALASRIEEAHLRIATRSLHAGLRRGRIIWGTIVTALSLLAAAASLIGGLTAAPIAFVVTAFAMILGNHAWRGNPMERWISQWQEAAARTYAHKHGNEDALDSFEFDWKEKSIVRKAQPTTIEDADSGGTQGT